MKLTQGPMYFPRLFSESQCPICAKILQWSELKAGHQAKAECCNKIFIATLNYVGITIEDNNVQKEITS